MVAIDEEVNPRLILPEIQRRTVARHGPALLFRNVTGSRFPVASNLFGSAKRIDLAFGGRPERVIQDLVEILESLPPRPRDLWSKRHLAATAMRLGLRRRRSGPILDRELSDLGQIPALTCWPRDGGPFVTLPLVYTEDPETGKSNLGMYRIQIQGPRQAGMHIQIHRGGGNHYAKAEKADRSLPAVVFVGGPPALVIAAVAPLPEDVPEVIFASLLQGRKLDMIRPQGDLRLPLVAQADFAIYGQIPPHRREPEGPFGDHYGYYSLEHPYPVLEVKRIFHRRDAIYPATVVGRPPQEDHFIAVYLQDLLKPLFPLVLKGVVDVFAYEESGVHSAAAAVVHERYYRESFSAALRVLGEGQLSLTKVLFATDQCVDVRDFKSVLTAVLERCCMETDVFVFSNISLDTLDYTGPDINRGSKALLLGTGDARHQLASAVPESWRNPLFGQARLFVPGCLVVKGPAYSENDGIPELLVEQGEVKPYRLVILHDDPADAVRDTASFLWNVFTRFEPGGDVYGQKRVIRNHIAFSAPLVVDCRMKPSYPDVLVVDDESASHVDQIWDQLGIDHWIDRRGER